MPAAHSGLPAIADDAGLCVDAFGGQPGVTRRITPRSLAMPRATTTMCKALLEQMQDVDQPPRRHGQYAGGRAFAR